MTKIDVSGADDFQQEVVFAMGAGTRIRNEVWNVVKAVSVETRNRIKIRMPVDYGDARGRWGTPAYRMRRPRYGGAAGQGIWRENQRELEIEQGAELEPYEYIKRLNEGHSRQAPAGFIDITAEEVNDELTDGVLDAVVRVFNT